MDYVSKLARVVNFGFGDALFQIKVPENMPHVGSQLVRQLGAVHSKIKFNEVELMGYVMPFSPINEERLVNFLVEEKIPFYNHCHRPIMENYSDEKWGNKYVIVRGEMFSSSLFGKEFRNYRTQVVEWPDNKNSAINKYKYYYKGAGLLITQYNAIRFRNFLRKKNVPYYDAFVWSLKDYEPGSYPPSSSTVLLKEGARGNEEAPALDVTVFAEEEELQPVEESEEEEGPYDFDGPPLLQRKSLQERALSPVVRRKSLQERALSPVVRRKSLQERAVSPVRGVSPSRKQVAVHTPEEKEPLRRPISPKRGRKLRATKEVALLEEILTNMTELTSDMENMVSKLELYTVENTEEDDIVAIEDKIANIKRAYVKLRSAETKLMAMEF